MRVNITSGENVMRISNYLRVLMVLSAFIWICSGCDDSGGGGGTSGGGCGNGLLEPGEECDGDNLNGQSCESMGFARGNLGCSDTCTFDYKQCVSKSCGNGKIDEGEECDGDNVGGMTCKKLGYESGELACDETCHVDLSGCLGGECDATQLDEFECTDDILNGYECDYVLQAGWCIIDGACVPEGATSIENMCEGCSPEDSTSLWSKLGGVPCTYNDGKGVCLDGQCLPDRDGDLVTNAVDNCPGIANADQLDSNGNAKGDECEVMAISAGETKTCAVTITGHVYCWGGEVSRSSWMPELVTTESGSPLADITDVQVGHDHVCALDAGGSVWCWGNNTYGELGNGTIRNSDFPPMQVVKDASGTPLGNIIAIDTGYDFSCALDRGNGIWCWGRNTHFQVGQATDNLPVSYARAVVLSSTFKKNVLTTGTHHVCVSEPDLSGDSFANGEVWCWGYNEKGQLGNPYVDVPDATSVAYRLHGGVWVNNRWEIRPINSVQNVSAGKNHTCIVIYNGSKFSVMCTGDNTYKQITGTDITYTKFARNVLVPGSGPIGDISCGDEHTCIVRTSTRNVYCWGNNNNGQLGLNSLIPAIEPSSSLHPVSTIDGSPLTNIMDVSAGSTHTCAVDNNGDV